MAANIYEILKGEIISGKRRPGEVFEEKVFAGQLGVSRTPVREAVLQLAREGLLVVMPRRGTMVSNISMEDIRQLYEARRILEPQIMRIAAKRAEKKGLETWKAFFERQKKQLQEGGELPKFPGETETQICPDADAAYHLFLAESTGNRYILKQMEELMTQTQRIRNLSNVQRKNRYQASIEEHIRMTEALQREDGEQAAEEVLCHLRNSEEGYRKMMLEDMSDMIQIY